MKTVLLFLMCSITLYLASCSKEHKTLDGTWTYYGYAAGETKPDSPFIASTTATPGKASLQLNTDGTFIYSQDALAAQNVMIFLAGQALTIRGSYEYTGDSLILHKDNQSSYPANSINRILSFDPHSLVLMQIDSTMLFTTDRLEIITRFTR